MASNINGLSVYCDSTVLPEVCDNSSIQTIHIVRNWSDINTAYDYYVWTDLLTDISMAVSYGKKFALTIVAGEKCPDFIYASPYSVPSISFDEYDTDQPIGDITTRVVPVFTDTTYKTLWKKFLADLSAMLKTEYIVLPGDIWNALSRITITGINRGTGITTINKQTNLTNGVTASSNAVELWQTAGVTSNNLVNTFVDFYYYFEEYFTNITKVVYLENEGFPELDDLYIDFLLVDTVYDDNLPLIFVYDNVSMYDHGKELFSWIRTVNLPVAGRINRAMFENASLMQLEAVLYSVRLSTLGYKIIEIYPPNVLNSASILTMYENSYNY